MPQTTPPPTAPGSESTVASRGHDQDAPRVLRVALLGAGTVGTQVARLILQQADDLEARIGARLELVGVAVRDLDRSREPIPDALLTTDAMALVRRGDLDVVIEVIGGIDQTRELVLAALESGASVVTANKALLAAHFTELAHAAAASDVDLYFEAAVAGAIPILRPLRESLVGDEIGSVKGIVNGTTNFILDQMASTGATFDTALAQAQDLGYAEADPTADIEGDDAAAKAAILASLAFHTNVEDAQVYREGITKIRPDDLAVLDQMGYQVKLVASAELVEDAQVSVRVHPMVLPSAHPLSSIAGAFNAVLVESREAGRLMFVGPGAGGAPTAAAVMGDLVTAARNRLAGTNVRLPKPYTARTVQPIDRAECAYFLRFCVQDRPGVLARVAQVFADHDISLRALTQQASDDPKLADLVVITHQCREGVMRECLDQLASAPFMVVNSLRQLRMAS